MTNTPMTRDDRMRKFESIGFRVSKDTLLDAVGDAEVLLMWISSALANAGLDPNNKEIIDANLIEQAKELSQSVKKATWAAVDIRARLEIPYYKDFQAANKRWLMERLDKLVDASLKDHPARITTLGTIEFLHVERKPNNEQS